MDDPKFCSKCKCDLSNKRYTCFYRGEEMIDVLCADCHKAQLYETYLSSGKLSTTLVTEASLDLLDLSYKRDDDYTKTLRYLIGDATVERFKEFKNAVDVYYDYLQVCKKIKEFEQKVWFSGLQKIIKKSSKKGVSGKMPFSNHKFLTYSMCGRTMITLEDAESSVTMICAEDSSTPSMGFRGIDGTSEQAIRLIQLAIELYTGEPGIKFSEDSDVSYCGM